jgi:4-amino-4-deoxychorismate lyase
VPIETLALLGTGVIDPQTPVATADDLGLTRGDGCFEGCRLRRRPDGTIDYDKIDRHLARMGRSAAALEIAFDEPAWRALINEAAAAWGAAHPGVVEAAAKLVLTRGRQDGSDPTGFVTISPLGSEAVRQRRDGVRLITLSRGTTVDAYADAPWLLGGVKTLSYVVNMAVLREATRRGADEGLLTTVDGRLLECPTSSLVWVSAQTLHTIARADTGILASTTLQLLFDRAAAAGWETVHTTARVGDLFAADVDAVLLVSSVKGVVQVVDVDGTPLLVTEAGQKILRQCRELTDFA